MASMNNAVSTSLCGPYFHSREDADFIGPPGAVRHDIIPDQNSKCGDIRATFDGDNMIQKTSAGTEKAKQKFNFSMVAMNRIFSSAARTHVFTMAGRLMFYLATLSLLFPTEFSSYSFADGTRMGRRGMLMGRTSNANAAAMDSENNIPTPKVSAGGGPSVHLDEDEDHVPIRGPHMQLLTQPPRVGGQLVQQDQHQAPQHQLADLYSEIPPSPPTPTHNSFDFRSNASSEERFHDDHHQELRPTPRETDDLLVGRPARYETYSGGA
ncbi:unnamed protein product, partial [Amoebophrya sp. A120]|eukprot:GSA120T00008129001.1